MKTFAMPLFTLGSVVTLASCAVAESPEKQANQALVGWYMGNGTVATFLPCGASEPLRIAEAADLGTRARATGMGEDNPVYVKLLGREASGRGLIVEKVLQFGSAIPVRNCAMTGVVNKSSGPPRH
jgi:hypothetical protein